MTSCFLQTRAACTTSATMPWNARAATSDQSCATLPTASAHFLPTCHHLLAFESTEALKLAGFEPQQVRSCEHCQLQHHESRSWKPEFARRSSAPSWDSHSILLWCQASSFCQENS